MTQALSISKRAKGFPLNLGHHHYFAMQMLYPWLQANGATCDQTDGAFALLPKLDVLPGDFAAAERGVDPSHMSFGAVLYRSKTLRIRAEHLEGMIKLLKLCSSFCNQGQVGGTLWRRAQALESVSTLDMLADAAR